MCPIAGRRTSVSSRDIRRPNRGSVRSAFRLEVGRSASPALPVASYRLVRSTGSAGTDIRHPSGAIRLTRRDARETSGGGCRQGPSPCRGGWQGWEKPRSEYIMAIDVRTDLGRRGPYVSDWLIPSGQRLNRSSPVTASSLCDINLLANCYVRRAYPNPNERRRTYERAGHRSELPARGRQRDGTVMVCPVVGEPGIGRCQVCRPDRRCGERMPMSRSGSTVESRVSRHRYLASRPH